MTDQRHLPPEWAFPRSRTRDEEGCNGMTLRDYFAAKAMAGYCAVHESWDIAPERMAECAYDIADAMLAAREAK